MRRGVIRVGVADDHPFAREGLVQLLSSAEDVVVVGAAADGRGALALGDEEPDVILLDVRMPGLNGLEAARRIVRKHPGVGIFLLSAYDDPRQLMEAVRIGARGYVLKDVDGDELLEAIRVVASGGMVIDLTVLERAADGGRPAEPGGEPLTEREVEILQLLASGRTNRQIADHTGLSPRAVRYFLDRIFEKLGTSDRTAAVAEALRRNVID